MRWRVAAVSVAVLTACGQSPAKPDAAPGPIDSGAAIDSGPSCEDLRESWHAAVLAAGNACDTVADCAAIAAPGCLGGDDIGGQCGAAVNAAAYAAGPGPGLEQVWAARACALDGIVDCPDPVLECVDNACGLSERVGCLDVSNRAGAIIVAEIAGPAAVVDVEYLDVDRIEPPTYDDRGPVASGCVVRIGAAQLVFADEGSVAITGARTAVPDCTFDTDAAAYDCDAPSGVDFLDDGDVITVTKAASGEIEPFTVDVPVVGAGVTLDDASTQLDALPTDGSSAAFSCEGSGGTCGTGAFTILRGAAVGAGDQPVSWHCLSSTTSLTIPAPAMAAILSADPSMLETRYLRASMFVVANPDGRNPTTVLVGHELVGVTGN